MRGIESEGRSWSKGVRVSEFPEEVTFYLGLGRKERINHTKGSVGTKVRAGVDSWRNTKEAVTLETVG